MCWASQLQVSLIRGVILQVSPTSVYAGFRTVPAVGTTLAFYDLATMEDNGKANITSIQAVNDQDTINNFQNGLTDLYLLDWDVAPVLIELDAEVNMTNSYALLDAIQVLVSMHPWLHPSV